MYLNNRLSEASKSCLDNAKQYLKDAELLFSTNSYGHALALTVLCDIELGKAVIYHLCYKRLITEEVLPNQYLCFFKCQKKIRKPPMPSVFFMLYRKLDIES